VINDEAFSSLSQNVEVSIIAEPYQILTTYSRHQKLLCKRPVGYFLADKMNAKDQATLVKKCLEKAANANLKVWSVTADGTAVNI
jgi:hypothetical protein